MLNISVIIPVYNAEVFLEKAVNSALQHDEVKEILLIEDKSTDTSLELCRKLAAENSKIFLLQHPDKGNHGAGASRNLGLEKATQDFIAFLDADDYYLPNRFEAEKELFKDPKIEGVFGAIGTEFLSEKGKKEFQEKFKQVTLTTVKYPAEGAQVFEGLMGIRKGFGHFFHLNTLTVKAENIKKNKLKFNEKLRIHQDTDFIVKMSYHLYLKSGIIDKAVAIRGVHDDNRITKVKQYSSTYFRNMFLLYESRYIWSKKQEKLSPVLKKTIKNRYISYRIATRTGFSKYFTYVTNSLFNPVLLKTRYRFVALKKHL
ncbi:Glycosyltransferase involved in cell wall bisynthesis [Halpernia humi]|uniref:Glycosyltransferase involved in cell wall bisynthesis n=1 Tax=Halpernia humi TaxID=493375 RepID=A0A1H5W6I0_9FLAO|nr:glycosyltransferase family 2 protein [Halpernia humi]SEF94948.1 Glycosyltransferase involved in cell wall bisynthesis [Halpernia humi]